MTALALSIIVLVSFATGSACGCARYYAMFRRERIRARFYYHQYVRDVRKHDEQESERQ